MSARGGLVSVLAVVLAACGGTPESVRPPPHADGWCAECNAGFIASIRVPSRDLFETLDAHGHDVDPAAFTCEGCKEALRTGGFCDRCRMGFVGGQAYLSRLTYHVARARVEDPATIACAACRTNAAGHGWCGACGVGRIGPLVLATREDLAETWKALERLHRAIAELERCETCGVALFTGGRCRDCGRSFRDG
jgi:hypothetical protein